MEPLSPELNLSAPAPGRAYRFDTLLKPSVAKCALDCDDRFYLRKQDLLHRPKALWMSDSARELHIRQCI